MENTISDLYVLNTHPYHENIGNIKISGNPEYTSPILNSFETKKEKFDSETAKSHGFQIHCIYYDSKQGKFIRKLINNNLVTKFKFNIKEEAPLLSEIILSKISKSSSIFQEQLLELLKQIGPKKADYSNKIDELEKIYVKQQVSEINASGSIKDIESKIKNDYLNRKVSLRSIYIELIKHKIFRSSSNGNFVETNHLDFLPPVMQIIGYKFTDDKKKICEDTGNLKLEFKCKWFNHITKGFSEEYIPYQALVFINNMEGTNFNIENLSKLIANNQLIKYKLDKYNINNEILEFDYINEKEAFKLEGINIEIKSSLLQPKDVIFKHYFHTLQSVNLVSQTNTSNFDFNKMEILDESLNFLKIGIPYPSFNLTHQIKIYDCTFKKGEYYYIQYKDDLNRITKRIIRISEIICKVKDIDNFNSEYSGKLDDLETDFSFILDEEKWQNIAEIKSKLLADNNVDISIKTNCLLRRGKLRYFKLKNIIRIIEIKSGKDIFEI